MADVKYKYQLFIIPSEQKDSSGKIIRPSERINIPVDFFEVDGGADRKIDVTSGDEISIGLEFEQARIYKNLIFYIPPTKDFLAVKLIDLRKSGPEQFSITFAIGIYTDGALSRSLVFSSESAWLFGHPQLSGGKSPLLKMAVRFSNLQLVYGHFDPKLKRVDYKEI